MKSLQLFEKLIQASKDSSVLVRAITVPSHNKPCHKKTYLLTSLNLGKGMKFLTTSIPCQPILTLVVNVNELVGIE